MWSWQYRMKVWLTESQLWSGITEQAGKRQMGGRKTIRPTSRQSTGIKEQESQRHYNGHSLAPLDDRFITASTVCFLLIFAIFSTMTTSFESSRFLMSNLPERDTCGIPALLVVPKLSFLGTRPSRAVEWAAMRAVTTGSVRGIRKRVPLPLKNRKGHASTRIAATIAHSEAGRALGGRQHYTN